MDRDARPCPLYLGMAFVLALAQAPPAEARIFNVPCDDAALLAVLGAVETNGEEDVLWLAEACTYALDFAWIVDHDGGSPEGFPVTVHGRGTTISGSDQHPVFVVNPTAVLSLHGVTVRDGANPGGDGGAILNLGVLTLTDCTVSDSQARQGGGIFNSVNGRLTLIRSTVSGNATSYYGAGIHSQGRLTLLDSTVSGNSASGTSSAGGGIYSVGANARTTLANSTVSGNSSRFGAGVFSDGGATAIHNSTLAGNLVRDGGNGGGLYVRTSSVKLAHSIVADSDFEFDNGFECVRDLGGTIATSSANLVEDGSCALPDALSGDPRLGAPAGSPAHYPLLPGSPAIDAGGNQYCTGLDQRGEPRRDGDGNGLVACDLGSYEAP